MVCPYGYSGVVDTMKSGLGSVRDAIGFILSCLSPSNVRSKIQTLRSMTGREIVVGACKLNLNIALMLLTFLFTVLWSV